MTFDDEVLAAWQTEARAGNFPLEHAGDWYARVQEMRERADYYERSLIRYLRDKDGMNLTWAQVAEVVNANLASRQAAQVKWKRLVDTNRGTVRRGRTAPGRKVE
jgi:hypothetical protein